MVAGRGDRYLLDDGDGDGDGDGEPHTVEREALMAAWAAHRKGRFAITTLDAAHVPDVSADPVLAAARTTHAHLTGPVLGHSFDANLGLSGIRRLAADQADPRTVPGWRRRFGRGDAFLAARVDWPSA